MAALERAEEAVMRCLGDHPLSVVRPRRRHGRERRFGDADETGMLLSRHRSPARVATGAVALVCALGGGVASMARAAVDPAARAAPPAARRLDRHPSAGRLHRQRAAPRRPGAVTAADRVIPIGTAVNLPDLTGPDPRYAATLAADFSGVTPENEMKWETTEPAPGVFDFRPADAIVNWATAHGMTVHGHTLVWDEQLPTWLTSGDWTRSELEAILRRHIETEVTHFRGSVHEWDVVNQPLDNDGRLQDNLWLRVIGPDYIAMSLRWAHAADPTAKLFINEYNVDWPGPKERALLALARRLRAAGAPLDGIGMQEHLSLQWAPSPAQLAQAMSDFASLGLEIEVTEADVDTTAFAGSPADAQGRQAQVFGELASACRAQPACARFSVWGVSDAVSWLGSAAAALPFDTGYQPTPAWAAIIAGLANPGPSSP